MSFYWQSAFCSTPFTDTHDFVLNVNMPDRTKFLNFQSIIYKSTDIFWNVSNSTQNVEVIALHKINGTVKKKEINAFFLSQVGTETKDV